MSEEDRIARNREQQNRDLERAQSAREVFDWVTNFNRTQAMQIEQDLLRAEQNRTATPTTEPGYVPEPTDRPTREYGPGPTPESGPDNEEARRDSDRITGSREVFDWVTNFNRTQAMQIEQDLLRAEQNRTATPTTEPGYVPEPTDRPTREYGPGPTPESGPDNEEARRDSDRITGSREVFDWVTNFNRTQAMQIEQDLLRAEQNRTATPTTEPGYVPEPTDRPTREYGPGPTPESGPDNEEARRDSDRITGSREVFDWVTNFNRTQAMQIEQDLLRAEQNRTATPTTEPGYTNPNPQRSDGCSEGRPTQQNDDNRVASSHTAEERPRYLEEYLVTDYGRTNIPARRGDGLEGHEIIEHAFLKALGVAENSRGRSNAVIFLTEERHEAVTKEQQKAGLHDPDRLARMSISEVLDKNIECMLAAQVPESAINRVVDYAMEQVPFLIAKGIRYFPSSEAE